MALSLEKSMVNNPLALLILVLHLMFTAFKNTCKVSNKHRVPGSNALHPMLNLLGS
jgi:hypothetical protein